jgi:hypothetical protein
MSICIVCVHNNECEIETQHEFGEKCPLLSPGAAMRRVEIPVPTPIAASPTILE